MSDILDRNPILADDFYIQLEAAKAHARHAEAVAVKSRAELWAWIDADNARKAAESANSPWREEKPPTDTGDPRLRILEIIDGLNELNRVTRKAAE